MLYHLSHLFTPQRVQPHRNNIAELTISSKFKNPGAYYTVRAWPYLIKRVKLHLKSVQNVYQLR